MNQTQELAQKPISRLLLSYFIPAFIGVFINALYNIVDRIFIGNMVGGTALSGVSIIFPIMLALTAFGMLLGVGGGILVSINLGRNNKDKAEQVLGTSFVLMLIASVSITILGFIFKKPLLHMFGATAETLQYANEYLNYILMGTTFQLVGFSLNNIIRSEGNAKVAMQSMIISAATNILLDYIFVYHLNMGVSGAAIATVISMAVLFVWVIIHFRSSRSIVRIQAKYTKLQFKIAKEICVVGFPPFTMQIAGSVVQTIMTTQLVTLGGDLAVGAIGIINSIATMIVMCMVAINMAAQPIFGYNYGASEFARVKSCLKLSIIAATIIGVVSFFAIELLPYPMVKLFNKDTPELIALSKEGLVIALAALPIVGFQVIAGNYFQSVGKSNIATLTTLLRQVIFLIPLILILPQFFGLNGVWIAMPISDILAGTFVFLCLRKDWVNLNAKINASKTLTLSL